MTSGQPLSGFRLSRLEVRNWGTFDDLVWTLRADGRNTLVTGDIGSGKSTIVDAVTTLLLPANRISYNKAAGAEAKERSLRSYVLGFYKSEQNEATGTTRPIALRDATKFSVILGVFTNEGYDATVTLAQVFWMKNGDVGGQPDRFYVTADTPLSIAGDFLEFGGDMARLRKRLKAADGVRLHDAFPEYGRDFRRRLGIESEQAMELFHQTVSMKSVGNLTDFVREHMLEPFNAAQADQGHRRPLRAPDQRARGRAARPGAARRAHPAARGLRHPRQAGRRDRRAERPARGAALLLRRSQGPPSRRAARPAGFGTGSAYCAPQATR